MYGQQRMTWYFGDRIRPTFVGLTLIACCSTPLYWIDNPNVDKMEFKVSRDWVYPLVAI